MNDIIIIIIINIILSPLANHVSRYSRRFAAIPWLHFVHLMLFPNLNIFYFHITNSPSMCAVSSMANEHNSPMSCFNVCCSGTI
jgi:hypothetical protein